MGKFGPKNSKLSSLAENWHTECRDDDDFYSNITFFSFQPKILFWPNLDRKLQSCSFWLKIGTHVILRMLILILRLVIWNSKPKFIFWTNLSRKTWIPHSAWKLVHRVSWGCDCKNTEQGLEEKIKMKNCIKCLLLLYLYRS